jgi:hypothetical protein
MRPLLRRDLPQPFDAVRELGRGYAPNAEQRRQALARLDAGEASREIARTFNVAHTTIGMLARAAEL